MDAMSNSGRHWIDPPLIRQRVIHQQASEAPRHTTDSRTPAVGEVNTGGEHDTKLPEAAGFCV
jgi:hypothetical protein